MAGVTAMPLRARDPAHVVRVTAKVPANNKNKTILIFFISKPHGEETTKPDLPDPF